MRSSISSATDSNKRLAKLQGLHAQAWFAVIWKTIRVYIIYHGLMYIHQGSEIIPL